MTPTLHDTASSAAADGLEAEVLAIGRQLGRRRRSARAAKHWMNDRAMALAARDPQLQAALFRLVDVAPAFAEPAELAEHLVAYLDDVDARALPVALGARAAATPVLAPATGRVAAAPARQMAGRFIVGESIAAAAPTLGSLWDRGTAVTVDLLGEATLTHAEGQSYADRCDEALVALAAAYARRAGLASRDLEIQVLRGLGDDVQDAVAAAGLRGRTYCPVGDMVAGMAYLVRRLLENTSNTSFLASRASGSDLEDLLRCP